MKTRIICLLMAMVMVLGMLVSCGDDASTDGGNKVDPDKPGVVPDTPDQGLYDTYWKTSYTAYPHKDIWCYTGYTLESDLLSPSRARCEVTDEFLSLIDVLVDGEFIEAQRDLTLLFRGSRNQRLIDLPKTLEKGEVVVWEEG